MTFGDTGVQLTTVEQALVFSKAVIDSGLAPKNFTSPQAIMIVVQMGAEIGLPPMASIQNIAVINGKPGVYGDMGKGMLRARGFDIEETCDGQTARCTISHPKQKPVTRLFTVDDAKKAGLWGKTGPWSQYPTRMLSWRAFWWAARDAAADVLKGVGGVEELRDIPGEPKNVTPAPSQRLSALDEPVPTVTTTLEPDPAIVGDEQTRMDLEASRQRGEA